MLYETRTNQTRVTFSLEAPASARCTTLPAPNPVYVPLLGHYLLKFTSL